MAAGEAALVLGPGAVTASAAALVGPAQGWAQALHPAGMWVAAALLTARAGAGVCGGRVGSCIAGAQERWRLPSNTGGPSAGVGPSFAFSIILAGGLRLHCSPAASGPAVGQCLMGSSGLGLADGLQPHLPSARQPDGGLWWQARALQLVEVAASSTFTACACHTYSSIRLTG